MRVLSVNVGLPREVFWRGKPVTTGIWKEPVLGPVRLHGLNLDGDRQADLRVHGGPDKAVYAYPSEFYELWSRERPELDLGPGSFGENLTTEGLLDDDVSVGDRFRLGTAELVVTATAVALLQARDPHGPRPVRDRVPRTRPARLLPRGRARG